MKLSGGSVDVSSGTTVSAGIMQPAVQMAVESGTAAVLLHMRPAEARRVGLDLIAAASSAMADTGVRRAARAHGLDGDGILETMAGVVAETLALE